MDKESFKTNCLLFKNMIAFLDKIDQSACNNVIGVKDEHCCVPGHFKILIFSKNLLL